MAGCVSRSRCFPVRCFFLDTADVCCPQRGGCRFSTVDIKRQLLTWHAQNKWSNCKYVRDSLENQSCYVRFNSHLVCRIAPHSVFLQSWEHYIISCVFWFSIYHDKFHENKVRSWCTYGIHSRPAANLPCLRIANLGLVALGQFHENMSTSLKIMKMALDHNWR